MHYTLCDMFSDLTQNAVEAGASTITVRLSETDHDISISIEDNGKGMSRETLKKATDPFYTDGIKHPGRKVGLGIPFLIQTAETCGGSWNIRSEPGHGTTVDARFDLTNIDTPPVGDVTGYFRQILTFDGEYEMTIARKNARVDYTVRRSELLEALDLKDEGSFSDANALSLLGAYLESMEE
jgi:hypothetical protein